MCCQISGPKRISRLRYQFQMIGKSPVEAPSTNQSSDGALLQMIQAPQTFLPGLERLQAQANTTHPVLWTMSPAAEGVGMMCYTHVNGRDFTIKIYIYIIYIWYVYIFFLTRLIFIQDLAHKACASDLQGDDFCEIRYIPGKNHVAPGTFCHDFPTQKQQKSTSWIVLKSIPRNPLKYMVQQHFSSSFL